METRGTPRVEAHHALVKKRPLFEECGIDGIQPPPTHLGPCGKGTGAGVRYPGDYNRVRLATVEACMPYVYVCGLLDRIARFVSFGADANPDAS